MSIQAPFEAFIKIVPATGKRFDTVRDMQRLAAQVFSDIDAVDGINLAYPGGGQSNLGSTSGGFSPHQDYYTDYAKGMMAKPQIGNAPAQLTVAGFYEVVAQNLQPADDVKLIHAGQVLSGVMGQKPWINNPSTAVQAEVLALKTAIEAAISTVVDSTGVSLKIFRLIYKNIVYGDRGHTMPR